MSIICWMPVLLAFLLICLMGVIDLSAGAPLPPVMISWCMVYYWSMFRPSCMPLWSVIAAGLVQDVLYGFPMGVSALALLVLRLGTQQVQHFMRATHFMATWVGFALVCALLALTMALCFMLVVRQEFWDMLGQWLSAGLLTWIAYPLLHGLNNALYKHMPTVRQ